MVVAGIDLVVVVVVGVVVATIIYPKRG